jgi:hypothetical protein
LLRFDDSTNGNSLRLEVPTDNTINIYGDNISASGLITNGFTLNPGTLCKIAISYDATQTKAFINGSSVTINAPTGVLNIINKIYNNTTSMNNINIHRAAVFNTVKSDSNLKDLTS